MATVVRQQRRTAVQQPVAVPVAPPAPPEEHPAHVLALVQAVTRLRRAVDRTGPGYADVVEAVMDCLEEEMQRAAIGRLIARTWTGNGTSPETRGLGARYIFLAQVEREQWQKNWTPLKGTVEIDGHQYRKPMEALRSGRVTFTACHTAFRGAVLATRARGAPPPGAFNQAYTALQRMMVTAEVEVDGQWQPMRVHVTEHVSAFIGALSGLLSGPAAAQVMTVPVRRRFVELLAKTKGLSQDAQTALAAALQTATAVVPGPGRRT